jgi:RimJ/RimL family protein N-acetyltransferase
VRRLLGRDGDHRVNDIVAVVAETRLAPEPGEPPDIEGVVALIGRVFVEYGWVFSPAQELADLFAVERHYVAPHGAFWVVRRDGGIVGSVAVERLDADTAELHRLYLDADLRGRRLGRELVETVLAWCARERITRLVLWSDTRFDRAHALYERMGFARTGERVLPDDPNDTREYSYARPVAVTREERR